MLKSIITDKCGTAPVILCDNCHRPITDVKLALALWFDSAPFAEAGKIFDVLHVHKGVCDRQIVARYGIAPASDKTSELGTYLSQTIHNCGMSPRDIAWQEELAAFSL